MKIVVTGGGSGGHITPILAVAAEIKAIDNTIEIDYIGQKGDGFAEIPAADHNITSVYSVQAGKFRRYHDEGWKQILDMPTMYKNIRDGFKTIIGLGQSILLLSRIKPNIVFTRGGFISVPVGLAAGLLKIPYITHDSDGVPSLANRIIAGKAVVNAVALPEEHYPYDRAKTVMVGVPVSDMYKPVTPGIQEQYRRELGIEGYKHVVFITGGGLGAQRLNRAVVANSKTLLQHYPGLVILHAAGRAHAAEVQQAYADALDADALARVQVKDYITDLYRYSGSADVIITRGGATIIAECAIQGRACIIVPNPLLTGGHQLVNSATLRKSKAIIELTEDQILQENRLSHTVSGLLNDPKQRAELAAKLATYARPDAAEHLAMVLLNKAKADPQATSKTDT